MVTTNTTIATDPRYAEKREQFADRLIAAINSAGLTMMISIGHRTGLFDHMMEMDWERAGGWNVPKRCWPRPVSPR